nr:DnaJ domain-containing protein [Sphingosinithalassobacter portus]
MFKFLTAALVAYLGWRMWHGFGPLPGSPKPAQEPPVREGHRDACTLLDVPADADAEQIRAAHRRLIARVHPDRGGSAELTRRVNAARDLLLQDLEANRPKD